MRIERNAVQTAVVEDLHERVFGRLESLIFAGDGCDAGVVFDLRSSETQEGLPRRHRWFRPSRLRGRRRSACGVRSRRRLVCSGRWLKIVLQIVRMAVQAARGTFRCAWKNAKSSCVDGIVVMNFSLALSITSDRISICGETPA